jgi:plastocyanin
LAVRRAFVVIGLVAMVPLFVGGKCIAYDERFAADGGAGADSVAVTVASSGGGASTTTTTSTSTSTSAAGATASSSSGGGFKPAVDCGAALIARVKIVNREFSIQCGCAEGSGKTCTIPLGTTVTWQFADSEEHNVTSNGFGQSVDKLAGSYKYTFKMAGSYAYRCTLHPSMVGYTIVVLP